MKLDTLKDSEGPQVGATNRERRPGTLKNYRVIAKMPKFAFGVVATDINNDGLMDLFVANDSVFNFLYLNKGGGKFEEIGFQAGVAYSADGAARSGMGVDAIDFDGGGRQDLFVANINRERYSLCRNSGDNTFQDVAGPTGIGMATVMNSGWGCRFVDFIWMAGRI